MAGFIGVHVGAGNHSSNLQVKYERLCRKACKKGIEILLNGGNSVDAVTAATQVLEDSPLTNAGYGSNLTWDGRVECDASVMDGFHLQSGAVGAVAGVKNPVTLARLICDKQREPLSLGRVQPCLLVGNGAREWASRNDVTLVDPASLISERAFKLYNHYKKRLEKYDHYLKNVSKQDRLDTVGAICVDGAGHTAAACSSGGVVLKHSGRVGQAAIYGSGCWAQDGEPNDGVHSVAVTTSGTGEDLIKTCLARETARSLQMANCPSVSIHRTINNEFLNSPYLKFKAAQERLCGVIGLQKSCDKEGVEFLWGHTTHSMGVGYMSTNDSKPTSRMSRLPDGRTSGSTVVVEGVFKC